MLLRKGILKRITATLLILALVLSCIVLPQDTKAASSRSEICNTSEEIHAAFPSSYWSSLDDLKEKHPEWSFIALYTGMEWSKCFDGTYYVGDDYSEFTLNNNNIEYITDKNSRWYSPTSWFSTTIPGSFNWSSNSFNILSAPNWVQASEAAIYYCMDVRNWLKEEQIFQFLDMGTFAGTVEAVEKVFEREGSGYWTRPASETGIYRTVNKKKVYYTYAEALYEICRELNVNPVTIASRIVQEQGEGKSPLISGTYSFSPTEGAAEVTGYYNYFNIEATEGDGTADYTKIVVNGLREAYREGWNTRYKALQGGAKKLTDKYINRCQSTYYLQKFNVDTSSRRELWGQYMQNVLAPQHEAANAYKSYVEAGILDSPCTFLIPVYENMPEKVYPEPTGDGNPNYKLAGISVDGKTVKKPGTKKFDTDYLNYNLTVENDVTEVRIVASAYAADTTQITINGTTATGMLATNVSLLAGENKIKIVAKAENGQKRTYTVTITRNKPIVYGDVNGDDTWDIFDVAIMYSHVLKTSSLTGNAFEAADIDGDGTVDVFDIAYVYSYVLKRAKTVPQRTPEPEPPTTEPTTESSSPSSESEATTTGSTEPSSDMTEETRTDEASGASAESDSAEQTLQSVGE